MSEAAILRRLKTVDQLRTLCLSLMRAKKESDEKAESEKQNDFNKSITSKAESHSRK